MQVLTRAAADALPPPPSGRPALVTIAASAGGIPAISLVLRGLPADFPVPIALVLHRRPNVPGALPQILARETSLRVKIADEGEALAPSTVYIAPADRHLTVSDDHRLHLMDGVRINFVSSSANPLFDSAATSLHGRVIAVVLTGSGRNGTEALHAVKATGGVVIAQDPATAMYASMPAAAIQSGAVDYVLQLNDIAPALIALVADSPRDHATR